MWKTIILLFLLALWAESSQEQTSQDGTRNKTCERVLIRSKRRWVLNTFEVNEELPGPYPQFITELHNDKHLKHSILFKISGQGVTEEPLNVFTINETTGEIFLHKPIDRETYSMLRVKFDVMDEETDEIVDKSLAFIVKVKDMNDNKPTFIPEVININIPENTKEGQLPILLRATDSDEAGNDNSRISMRIVSQEPALPKISLDTSLNEKDHRLAKLFFSGCFDYDKVKTYKMLVEARDHGIPSLSSTATIYIHISDSNTHAPVFTDLKERVLIRSKRRWVLTTIELEEESPGPFPVKITKLFNDKISSHAVRFSITGHGVTEEPNGILSIDEKTGDVFMHKSIDRETYPIFHVQFNVHDLATGQLLDNTLSFDVAIQDKNDNAPLFTPPVLDVNLPENINEGELPFSLHASDRDEDRNDNSRISMRIVSQTPPLPKLSLKTPDERFTKLEFSGCFDYDKIRFYRILVEARDHGKPSLSSTATVNIAITDSNTHTPEIAAPKHIEVNETEINKEILRIPVKDKDTPNTPGSRAVFAILKGNEEGNYKIETDPLTNEGVLTVIKGIDFERTPLSELEIVVENEEPLFFCVDGKPVNPIPKNLTRSNKVKVAVKVIDVNDPPVFHNKIHIVHNVEEEEPGEVLYTPTVTDEDSDPAKIRYELGEDPAKWMSIDPQTGIITLAKKMDRESPYVNGSTYTVVMRAIDDGNPPGMGTGTLVIKLGDKNDNAPYLTYNPSVICGNKGDRVRVTAQDADVFPYSGPFNITLDKDDQELKSMWKFEHTVSEILLISLKSLPYGNYTVPVKIADQQGVQANDVLQVVICDCGSGTVCKNQLPRSSTLHISSIVIILLAILLLIALLLYCFFCKCGINRKEKIHNFMEFLQDDGIQTMVIYKLEGEGSCKTT
ncbi:cadherin-like protein 26 [Tachysurus fulvidraco]|uniref:cadherin-like protein 26 n=1 Tax=Tachysurus fulvidraco TaxID=1234273 RepID=UPI001FED74E9|nr:cadherin-like protein 26 [Tachysurus fulvidraco]